MAWVTHREFGMLERELKQTRRDIGAWRAEHLKQHQAEAEQRHAEAAARRWQLGFVVAAVGSLWPPMLYLIAHIR